jgi:aspartyl-tRNA(Asn)/glutamyl-tRNA(Gln) amidotransferase subunit A
VYGLKPTFGSVSLEGVVPFAPSFDHGGMIADGVRDLALSIQPIAGSGEPGPGVVDLAAGIGRPVRKVLGLPGGFFDTQSEPVMSAAFRQLVEQLRQKGWSVGPIPLPPAVADIPRYHRLIMSVEALGFHRYRWERYPDDYPPKLTDLFREGLAVPATDYHAAVRHHRALRAEMAARFPAGIAAYLAPATQGPPPDPSTTGTPLFQAPWSYMGLPTVSLPFAWTDDGLPLCVQVAGRVHGEAELLAVAAALESDISFERRQVPAKA